MGEGKGVAADVGAGGGVAVGRVVGVALETSVAEGQRVVVDVGAGDGVGSEMGVAVDVVMALGLWVYVAVNRAGETVPVGVGAGTVGESTAASSPRSPASNAANTNIRSQIEHVRMRRTISHMVASISGVTPLSQVRDPTFR